MSRERVESVVQAAILRGLLPPTARAPGLDARPWPIVLLTGLGAWLAALPLLGVVGMLFQGVLSKSVGLYGVGVLLIAVAMVVLRSRGVPLFVEQIAIPALLVGAGALGGGLFQDWSVQTGAAILVVVAVGIAIGVPQAWLRVLLGAAAAGMFAIACMPEHGDAFLGRQSTRFWIVWHLNLAIGLGLGGIQRSLLNDGARAGLAAALESLAAGWLVATLVGLSWWSGMTFLAGSTMGGGLAGEIARELSTRAPSDSAPKLLAGGSLICAIGAALWMGYGWHSLRRPANAGVALVLAALAWFMPALGGALLILAGCATSARWRLAASAGLAAAWIVGAFYYQLQWPLVNKALVLLASGALIGALAWFASRSVATGDRSAGAQVPGPTMLSRTGIALSALAVLLVANAGIWQKEEIIAHGQPIFVELAPVDPRSLMQGDFMRLNFRLPAEAIADRAPTWNGGNGGNGGLLSVERPRVIARRDAKGVATMLREDRGAARAADELAIELTPKDGRWILVTDAWFFKEGEAKRWEAARYGEFRVDANGRALLVGLRGPDLEAL